MLIGGSNKKRHSSMTKKNNEIRSITPENAKS